MNKDLKFIYSLFVTCVLGIIISILLLGCGDIICSSDAERIYEGKPYGGLITITERVNKCMGSNAWPDIEIYATDFKADTLDGCILVHGAADDDLISLAKPSLETSKGQLYAEELVHYILYDSGDFSHGHPCMNITWN